MRRAVSRYAKEQTSDQIPRLLKSAFSWIFNAALALSFYLYSDFLDFWSWQFLVIAGISCLLIFSVFRKQWKTATAALSVALGFLVWICVDASYFVASNQSRYRLRSIEGATYLEFRSENPISKFLAAQFPAKTITLGECGGMKIARLPRLAYPPIPPSGLTFANRIFFRRLPALMLDSIDASFTGLVGLSKDKWGDTKHTVSLQFGFDELEFKPVLLTQAFPRSLGCVVDSIPLLPILEVLPWDQENIGDLIKSARHTKQFLDFATSNKVTLKELNDLRSGLGPNVYGLLLDFVAHSLAYNMLDGNILAEARAQIREGQCNLINRNPNAFLGPFAALTNALYLDIVSQLRKHAYEVFPACKVPEGWAEKFPKSNSNFEPELKAFFDCFSSQKNPIERCPMGLGFENAQNPTLGPGSEQTYFDLLDKAFEETAVDIDGKFFKINQVDPKECLTLRDVFEERHYISTWQQTSAKMLLEPFACSSPEWNERYRRAQSNYEDAAACATSKHLFEGDSKANQLDAFDTFRKIRCDYKDPTLFGPVLKDQFVRAAEFYDKTHGFETIVSKFLEYDSIAGSESVNELAAAFLQIRGAIRFFCGDDLLQHCAERYRDDDPNREVPKISDWLSQWDLSLLRDEQLDLPGLYTGLKRLHNHIINLGVCDLSADQTVSEKLKMSSEEVCADLGVSRYRLLRINSVNMSRETWVNSDFSFDVAVPVH
jgi:hypothetical protein